jgi:hypothetical protein
MWDVPNPPRLDSCRFVPHKGPIPRRVRTVSLVEHVTGITVFCSSGHTYGIYAHCGKLSSPFDTYMKFPKLLRWSFVWLYFPLAPGEVIEDVWVRCRKSRSNTTYDGPALVVSILQLTITRLTTNRCKLLLIDFKHLVTTSPPAIGQAVQTSGIIISAVTLLAASSTTTQTQVAPSCILELQEPIVP